MNERSGESEARAYVTGQKAKSLPIDLKEIQRLTGWQHAEACRWLQENLPLANGPNRSRNAFEKQEREIDKQIEQKAAKKAAQRPQKPIQHALDL